ncbi:DNA recombination/repair protein RecA, partial [Clostridiales Family XIII bacterium BX16]
MATKKKEAKTINTSEDREKALSEALAQIQKQFGKGAVMKLGDDNPMMNIEAIST